MCVSVGVCVCWRGVGVGVRGVGGWGTNEIINVVELMMNGNKKRLGSQRSQSEPLPH